MMATREKIVIVGGGVIGIACAHYLDRVGFRVTIIDKGDFGNACSQGNCGYVCPSHVLPLTEPGAVKMALKSVFRPASPFRVQPRFDPALWHWMWQFARRCRHQSMLAAGRHLKAILDSSMVEYKKLIESDGLEAQWQEEGLLYVFRTERGLADFARTDALLHEEFGVAAERLEGDSLLQFDSALKADLPGAYFYRGDTHLRPDVLNRNWVRQLQKKGVQFRDSCELQSVRKVGGRVVSLQTSQGEIMADRFVFAMGAWSARLGGELRCRVPVEPGKGYSITMRRPEICPKHPMLFPEHKVGVTPFEDGYRLGSMMEFSGYDESLPEERLQQLCQSAEPYLLNPVSSEGERRPWFGWRPMTWDSLPIIGQVPALKNAYLATGHNMLGLSLAPATGRLLAELICEETPHLDGDAFGPGRF